MSFNFRQLDPRFRRLFAIANLSMAAGLLLKLFVHPSNPLANDWLHAICGFLLGLAIAIDLSVFIVARRCGVFARAGQDAPLSH
jgi:hypothetical protein